MNSELSKSVKDTKTLLNNYFSKTGDKNFKQFYYDWFSEQMYQPFADLVGYFKSHSNKQEFSNFVKDFSIYVDVFNNDNIKNEHFSIRNYSKTKDGSLKSIMDRVDSFSFQARQYVFSFAKIEEHNDVFVNYRGKTNMAYSYHKGLDISKLILKNIEKNYDVLNSKDKSINMVDTLMRKKIFKSYAFNDSYSYKDKSKFLSELRMQKEALSKHYDNDKSLEFADVFQTEYSDKPVHNGNKNYLSNGFELEFYYPENIGNSDDLIEHLKKKNNWKHIYTTSNDPSVYADNTSAGVIMPDVSLIPYDKLNPIEYASKILRNKADEQDCLKIFDTFDKGYVNKHCSLHQHIGTENFDLDTYKRLVKRVMQHEKKLVENFAAEERTDNKLLYATFVGNNLSDNAKKDYPLLCLMADICDNKEQLTNMVSYGQKYKTLNIVPKNTVEFRYMNGHFNKKFAEGFMQFNRDMVQSAIDNNGSHLNKALLNKHNWVNNQKEDTKTEIKDIRHLYEFAFDRFDPNIKVSDKVKIGDMTQAKMVNNGLNVTRQASVQNPKRFGRYY